MTDVKRDTTSGATADATAEGRRQNYEAMAATAIRTALPGIRPGTLEKLVSQLGRDAETVFGTPQQPVEQQPVGQLPVVQPSQKRGPGMAEPRTGSSAGSGLDYSAIMLEVCVSSNDHSNNHLSPSELKMFERPNSSISDNGAVSYRVNCDPNELWAPRNYVHAYAPVSVHGKFVPATGRKLVLQSPEGQGNSIKPITSGISGTFGGSEFHFRPIGRNRSTWGPVVVIDGELAEPFRQMRHYFDVSAAVQLDEKTRGGIQIEALVPVRVYQAVSANNFRLLEEMVRAVLPQDLVAYIESKPVMYSPSGSLEQRSIFSAPRMVVKAT